MPNATRITDRDSTQKTPRDSSVVRLDTLFGVLCVCLVVCLAMFLLYRPSVRVAAMSAVAVIGFVALWFALRRIRQIGNEEKGVGHLFEILLVTIGLLFTVFFSPGVVPDEGYHYGMTYGYSNLLLFQNDPKAIRNEDLAFLKDSDLYATTMNADRWKGMNHKVGLLATHEGVVHDDENYVRTIDFGANPPHFKIAPALGMMLGRILNLSGIATFYLGRLFNFAFFAALVILAVRIVPIGKNAMRAVALVPMTLHVAGSYSYDTGSIAFGFLLTALLLRLLVEDRHASRKSLVVTVVVAAMLAPGKIVYAPISILALFVPKERFSSRKEELVWKACMLALPLVAIALLRAAKIVSLAGIAEVGSTTTGSGVTPTQVTSADPGYYTLADAMAHPLTSVLILLRTCHERAIDYVILTFGYRLGWHQEELEIHTIQIFVCIGAVLVSSLTSPRDTRVLPTRVRVGIMALCAAMFVGVVLSMFFGWTVRGAPVVEGVQGRYFLPFLPLLLMGLRGKTIVSTVDLGAETLLFMGGFDLFVLAQLTFQVLGGFQ